MQTSSVCRSDGDNDLPFPAATLKEVPHRFRDLFQREHPVDQGRNLPSLDEVLEGHEVARVLLGDEPLDLLAREDRLQRRSDSPSSKAAEKPALAAFASNDDKRPPRCQSTPQNRQLAVSAGVEDDVVSASRLGEVLAGVVDDGVSSDRSHRVDLCRAAYAGYDRSERLRDLDREGSDTSRGTDDEHRLSGLNLPVIPDRLESGRARDRDGSRLLEREVRRLRSQLLDRGGRELRERTLADPVDGVADVERADVWTYRLDTTRDVPASHPDLRLRQTTRRTERERHPGHVVPVPGEEACGLNAQQHFTAADRRGVDVLEVQDVGPRRTCPGRSPSSELPPYRQP